VTSSLSQVCSRAYVVSEPGATIDCLTRKRQSKTRSPTRFGGRPSPLKLHSANGVPVEARVHRTRAPMHRSCKQEGTRRKIQGITVLATEKNAPQKAVRYLRCRMDIALQPSV
jgi:hypothetical protein